MQSGVRFKRAQKKDAGFIYKIQRPIKGRAIAKKISRCSLMDQDWMHADTANEHSLRSQFSFSLTRIRAFNHEKQKSSFATVQPAASSGLVRGSPGDPTSISAHHFEPQNPSKSHSKSKHLFRSIFYILCHKLGRVKLPKTIKNQSRKHLITKV